ncbi:GNAT family N-acetyltransferase [uncultured Amnibacterium sp.]|uniref:GNAT family N-acetyltransferase n=1 Tax=uncultured Amnibacterium sp. TaxID=1631851 RepID=UPI0035CA9EA5
MAETRRLIGRVAVLSDVHGVLPALEAVLAEPDVRSADRIVVTGDLAAGPQPSEVLDALTALGERVVLVRGNADRELVQVARGGTTDVPDPISEWAAAQLGPRHVALLAGLPHPVTLDIVGFGPVLFCHGSPRADDEVVLVDTRPAQWADVLADVPEQVRTVVGGHTHMPFVRLVDRRLVVVSGSVGMPYGRSGAHWALLADGAVTLRRTAFDLDAAIEQVAAASGYPDVRAWAEYFLRATASDVEVVQEFGSRDGRNEHPGDLITARLVLHPITPPEAERIVARSPRPDDHWHPEYPFADELEPLGSLAAEQESDAIFTLFQVRDRASGLAVGGIGFFGPPDAEGVVEVGYGFVAAARGRGFAVEALVELVRHGFAHGARVVRADTDIANGASQRVLLRAGFAEMRRERGLAFFEVRAPA